MSRPGLEMNVIFKAKSEAGELFETRVRTGKVKNAGGELVINLDSELFEPVGDPIGHIGDWPYYRMALNKEWGLKGRAWMVIRFLGHEDDHVPLYCVFT